ncbi:uncharacterized protein BDZ99DRAFT_220829 [Mytilinidion resinicola]|uniref:C2H2-type domain-containing protein n=1 Tax=Mytilinidion resinicola TaxID=574789 RepID=A0A6A6XZP6_9PEZI|nr:uncharacterized protein BDZ99DRAFT_220829 [Mytilinidion resinicola]KAF2801445.1 hypothetical protein BDZ99DRAFT_220829 [Mytilinidion resinicola]
MPQPSKCSPPLYLPPPPLSAFPSSTPDVPSPRPRPQTPANMLVKMNVNSDIWATICDEENLRNEKEGPDELEIPCGKVILQALKYLKQERTGSSCIETAIVFKTLRTALQIANELPNVNLAAEHLSCLEQNCHWQGNNLKDLNRHRRSHFQLEQWICPDCQNISWNIDLFKSHIASHDSIESTSLYHIGRNGQRSFYCGCCMDTVHLMDRRSKAWDEQDLHIEQHIKEGVFIQVELGLLGRLPKNHTVTAEGVQRRQEILGELELLKPGVPVPQP